MTADMPKIIAAPEPRTLDLIFRPAALRALRAQYDLVECAAEDIAALPGDVLKSARYIVGQPALSADTLAQLENLRCVFNVEGNFIDNMPYDTLFQLSLIHISEPTRPY